VLAGTLKRIRSLRLLFGGILAYARPRFGSRGRIGHQPTDNPAESVENDPERTWSRHLEETMAIAICTVSPSDV
jgi:hypothetical protein